MHPPYKRKIHHRQPSPGWTSLVRTLDTSVNRSFAVLYTALNGCNTDIMPDSTDYVNTELAYFST